MFEHKNLDGVWNRVLPASESYIGKEILEMRDNVSPNSKPETSSRRQYSVIGEQLVERCLPPESVGELWTHDASGISWWTRVVNPPHMGIIAEFNEYLGGKHRIPLNAAQNVVAYAGAGEEIVLKDGSYVVTRSTDNKEIMANNLIATRETYYQE